MRKLRKWIFTLGVMAAAPAAGMAGPFSMPSNPFKADKVSNQAVAEDIAASLRGANLTGTDIQIEFKSGVATLAGSVTDAAQKAKVTQVVSQVDGVKTVDNQLAVKSPNARVNPGIQQASFFKGPAQPRFSDIRQVSAEETTAAPSNQVMAENIAAALGSAGLNGYDIQIGFQNGTAILAGAVANPQQRALAESVASQVGGVLTVNNQLSVPGAIPQQQQQQQFAAQQMAAQQYAAQQQMAAQQYAQAGYESPANAGYGIPGSAGSHVVHNSPNLPSHAFPSYAAYPNYSAVSYPQQYSASAWPYIGPFYPYPQVPLGWRKASLVWEDGSWNLEFDNKTDKWWWFMHPKNWD